jgi:hypothetical protein
MRAAQQQAKNAETTATGTAAGAGEQASQIGSTLIPGLEREANNPEGYTPEQMNNQLVAGEEGAGGATAGITGQANLQVARTRNSAGYSNALDEAARDKTRTLSENALNVENKSANLGEEKQMTAQKELGSLYGTNVNENLEAQGLATKDIGEEVEAGKSGWFQNMTNLISTLSGAAKNGAQAYNDYENA